ncbi:MAG: T9SS type A sorting domain-containing protein, partial [Deltaproteobacteria bacterium]|nr:T9SS type A sorting domain-containing protein [Deltaproteobacteria bacterium]
KVYPRHKIWETQDIWGGQIADVDQDGKMEIIGRNNDSNAISIYESIRLDFLAEGGNQDTDFGDNSYQLVAQLENPTEGRNGLGTTFAISDFDGDGWIEIMAGDEEGDLFIYENYGDNQFRLTWQSQLIVTEAQENIERGAEAMSLRLGLRLGLSRRSRIETNEVYRNPKRSNLNVEHGVRRDEETPPPVQSAYYLAANDLDGDGRVEFIVGGKADDSNYSFIRRRWIYKIFTTDGDDSYHPVWAQGIRGIRSGGNGVTTGDNEHHAGKVFFANLPTDASISIYNITGELIEQLTVTAADQGKKEWYLLNNAAAELASGIYIYVLESNGQRKTGKLAVIR